MTVITSNSTETAVARVTLSHGSTLRMVAEHVIDITESAYAAWTRARYQSNGYRNPFGHQLEQEVELADIIIRGRKVVDRCDHKFHAESAIPALATTLLNLIESDAETLSIETTYRELVREHASALGFPQNHSTSAGTAHFYPTELVTELRVMTSGENNSSSAHFLSAASALLFRRRQAGISLTVDEAIAVRVAYTLLDVGHHFGEPYPIWGTSGFRDYQTYMSLTDPGAGHLDGTTLKACHLHGSIVHVEHLERGISRRREDLEPYRIPSPRTISRVRLHAGSSAPTSTYIGRPMFDGNVDDSMLKTARTFGAAATSLFADGLAECKLSIEFMTASQAITFMRSMSAATRFDRTSQVLSAAFNVNTPILDDRTDTLRRNGGKPVLVRDRVAVGMLGIELAKAGGFAKVTWDGTADTYPSHCIIEQLSYEGALSLVHRAHECGLLTYFSAGFRFNHLPETVATGVDGIGVGGAQILRVMDSDTGNHGPYLPENITKILSIRDSEAATLRGRAAWILARLDRMFFEGSLPSRLNDTRIRLFDTLRDPLADDHIIADELSALNDISLIPPDTAHPLMEWAYRIVTATEPIIAQSRLGEMDWPSFVTAVHERVDLLDLEGLSTILSRISYSETDS